MSLWGWRDGSAVRYTHCSHRGLELSSWDPHGGSHPSVTPVHRSVCQAGWLLRLRWNAKAEGPLCMLGPARESQALGTHCLGSKVTKWKGPDLWFKQPEFKSWSSQWLTIILLLSWKRNLDPSASVYSFLNLGHVFLFLVTVTIYPKKITCGTRRLFGHTVYGAQLEVLCTVKLQVFGHIASTHPGRRQQWLSYSPYLL